FYFSKDKRPLRLGALVDFHEVLALARLGGEVAELAEEAQARGAVHEEPLLGVARADPGDVVAAGVDQRVDVRPVAAARGDVGGLDGEALARGGEHGDRV